MKLIQLELINKKKNHLLLLEFMYKTRLLYNEDEEKERSQKQYNNEIINISNDVYEHVEVDNDDINYNNKVNDDLNAYFEDEIFDKYEMIKTLKLINDEEENPQRK